MADRYGWCHTAQCVADWSWGPNANNVFTLLGAIATFAAAYLALRFSQREAKRRQAEDLVRARLAAIANVHLIDDMRLWLDRVRPIMRRDARRDAPARLDRHRERGTERRRVVRYHVRYL